MRMPIFINSLARAKGRRCRSRPRSIRDKTKAGAARNLPWGPKSPTINTSSMMHSVFQQAAVTDLCRVRQRRRPASAWGTRAVLQTVSLHIHVNRFSQNNLAISTIMNTFIRQWRQHTHTHRHKSIQDRQRTELYTEKKKNYIGLTKQS